VEWSPLLDKGLKVQPLRAKRERFTLKHFRACFEADLDPLMDRFFFTLIIVKKPRLLELS
jgi:hypothetical protein